jgi:hypothetical protein
MSLRDNANAYRQGRASPPSIQSPRARHGDLSRRSGHARRPTRVPSPSLDDETPTYSQHERNVEAIEEFFRERRGAFDRGENECGNSADSAGPPSKRQ